MTDKPNIPQTKVYTENKILNFTPEHKLEEWRDLIQEKVAEGCLVKLYADTETTGFDHGNKGRSAYDPVMDQKLMLRSALAFDVPLADLEKEAKDLRGKVDRMIEIAFVACYTNKNGESYPLLDKEGNQVYFHEMIDPYKNSDIDESKRIDKMPIIPYLVHKTSFDFLQGKEEHPYLKVTLPNPAPSTHEVFSHFISFFKDNKPENYDKIVMIFHNADEFDMPFINSELKKTVGEPSLERYALRELVQVQDSLKIVKSVLLPNPVQKLIAFCQYDEFFGGEPSLKDVKEVAIQPTGKSLDNIIRIAKFLPSLDLSQIGNYTNDKQKEFANRFKSSLLANDLALTKPLLDYYESPNTEIDLADELDKTFVTKSKALIENYKKFRIGVKLFNDTVNAAKEYPELYKSLTNVKKSISEHADLQQNVDLLRNTPREAHGAMIDSLLFMYSFNIIENSLYRNHKTTNELNFSSISIKLPESLLENYKKIQEQKNESKDESKNVSEETKITKKSTYRM